MEHFSNGAFLKWSNSQIKHFSNGAIWGHHHQLDDSLVGQLTRTEYTFSMKSFNIKTLHKYTPSKIPKNVSLPVVHEFFLSKLPFCLRALVCRVIIGHVSLMQPGSRKALFRINGTNHFLSYQISGSQILILY